MTRSRHSRERFSRNSDEPEDDGDEDEMEEEPQLDTSMKHANIVDGTWLYATLSCTNKLGESNSGRDYHAVQVDTEPPVAGAVSFPHLEWIDGLNGAKGYWLGGADDARANGTYLALSRWSDFASGIVSFTVCVGLRPMACDVSMTTLDGNATDAWIDMSLATEATRIYHLTVTATDAAVHSAPTWVAGVCAGWQRAGAAALASKGVASKGVAPKSRRWARSGAALADASRSAAPSPSGLPGGLSSGWTPEVSSHFDTAQARRRACSSVVARRYSAGIVSGAAAAAAGAALPFCCARARRSCPTSRSRRSPRLPRPRWSAPRSTRSGCARRRGALSCGAP